MADLSNLKPKTMAGIKSLATGLKKAEKIPHHQALEKAAKQAGYENFKHAHNELEPKQ